MLRAQVAAELAKLVERKDFGLVFQRHLPEDLEVPDVRPPYVSGLGEASTSEQVHRLT